MSSWETTSYKGSKGGLLKPSLVKRAKKRECYAQTEPGWWKVVGKSSLGDAYGDYMVHLRDNDDHGLPPEKADYWCTCQNTTGGEFRPICSHKTSVVLKRQEDPWPWDEWNEQEGELTDSPDGLSGVVDDIGDVMDDGEDEGFEGTAEELDEEDPEDEVTVDTQAPEPRQVPPTSEFLWEMDSHELDPDTVLLPSQMALTSQEPLLPEKFATYRPEQWQAICEIKEAFDAGFKVVMVSAPTGAGKTLIGESARRMVGSRGIYTCTTKVLQDQIERDFDEYARVLKGRSNYPTLDAMNQMGFSGMTDTTPTTADCDLKRAALPACVKCSGYGAGSSWGEGGVEGRHCSHCHPWSKCPYQVAKMEAARSRMAVLNTALFLADTNYVSNSLFRGWPIVIIDEADKLEEELMRFIEVQVTPGMRRACGVGLPKHKGVDEEWARWLVDEMIPGLLKTTKRLESQLKLTLDGVPDVKASRQLKSMTNLLRQLSGVIEYVEEEETGDDIPQITTGWVYTGLEGRNTDVEKATITFKPVMVRDYAQAVLWEKAQRFVLMSATLISGEQIAYDLGLEDDEWTVVEVPSSFPVERRPIIPAGEVALSNKTMDEAYPVIERQVAEILEQHPNERVLIHSVSYKLTKEIFYRMRKRPAVADRMVTYFNAREREGALERYLSMDNGVIVAPSFDRGVDLAGDDCSVIIVAKVPYPYVGDAQIKARLYGTGRRGRIWYAMQTIRTICQMTGRGMRHKDDQCVTYVLDSNFNRLHSEHRKLFPNWWSDAIVWSKTDPQWRDALEELGVDV